MRYDDAMHCARMVKKMICGHGNANHMSSGFHQSMDEQTRAQAPRDGDKVAREAHTGGGKGRLHFLYSVQAP